MLVAAFPRDAIRLYAKECAFGVSSLRKSLQVEEREARKNLSVERKIMYVQYYYFPILIRGAVLIVLSKRQNQ